MKIKKKWIVLMGLMVIITIAGLFASEPSFECDFSKINGADVVDYRHNLCADDDTGSVVFLRRNGGRAKRHFHHVAELHSHGNHYRAVGSLRIQPLLWRRHRRNNRKSLYIRHVPKRRGCSLHHTHRQDSRRRL